MAKLTWKREGSGKDCWYRTTDDRFTITKRVEVGRNLVASQGVRSGSAWKRTVFCLRDHRTSKETHCNSLGDAKACAEGDAKKEG